MSQTAALLFRWRQEQDARGCATIVLHSWDPFITLRQMCVATSLGDVWEILYQVLSTAAVRLTITPSSKNSDRTIIDSDMV